MISDVKIAETYVIIFSIYQLFFLSINVFMYYYGNIKYTPYKSLYNNELQTI